MRYDCLYFTVSSPLSFVIDMSIVSLQALVDGHAFLVVVIDDEAVIGVDGEVDHVYAGYNGCGWDGDDHPHQFVFVPGKDLCIHQVILTVLSPRR